MAPLPAAGRPRHVAARDVRVTAPRGGGGRPVPRRDKIRRNGFKAVLIYNGGGAAEDNNLTAKCARSNMALASVT